MILKNKILVIEDDKNLREIVCEYLRSVNYYVEGAEDGKEGLDKFNDKKFDLIILDIMLPKISGLTLLSEFRKSSDIPIIMLTALGDEKNQIDSFNLRADDYVTKPFSPNILIKRVEAVLRRCGKVLKEDMYIGDIYIDFNSFRAYYNKEDLGLTVKEFELLRILGENMGKVLTREKLLDKVWGYDFYGDDRIVDAHIKNLRKKLPFDIIKTLKGVGYMIDKVV